MLVQIQCMTLLILWLLIDTSTSSFDMSVAVASRPQAMLLCHITCVNEVCSRCKFRMERGTSLCCLLLMHGWRLVLVTLICGRFLSQTDSAEAARRRAQLNSSALLGMFFPLPLRVLSTPRPSRLPVKSALDLKQERWEIALIGHVSAFGIPLRLTGTVTKYLPVSGYGMVKSRHGKLASRFAVLPSVISRENPVRACSHPFWRFPTKPAQLCCSFFARPHV